MSREAELPPPVSRLLAKIQHLFTEAASTDPAKISALVVPITDDFDSLSPDNKSVLGLTKEFYSDGICVTIP